MDDSESFKEKKKGDNFSKEKVQAKKKPPLPALAPISSKKIDEKNKLKQEVKFE